MNKIFEKYLSPDHSKKLINYVENQLESDLENFEEAFGYKGNTSLIKWLILNNILDGKEINFPRDDEGYLPLDLNIPDFLLYSNIFNSIKKNKLLEYHGIGNHDFGGFIQLFTSSLMISGDGMGNYFYANFHSENSDIIFYDHESSMDSYKALTIDDLLKIQPIKYLDLLVDLVVIEKGERLGINDLGYKEDFQIEDDGLFKEEVFNFMLMLEGNKSLKTLASPTSNSPFSTEGELSNLLTNKESDYHKYGNVRAKYNPIIAANLYWYYLTNQPTPFLQLLEDSKNIKGKYYLAIRNSFEQVSRKDFSKFHYAYRDLISIRKNINLQSSSIIDEEQKYFVKDIEEIEQKNTAILAEKLKHQNDNYFLFSGGGGEWGLYPEDTKYLREKVFSNFKAWENPVPIVTFLKSHYQKSGEPKELPDILSWLTGSSLGGKTLIVSERLKEILQKNNLQKNNFYPLQVKSYGKILSYFVFVPFLGEVGYEIIDYSKTMFYAQESYAQEKGKPKKIFEDNMQFVNSNEHFEMNRKYMTNKGEVKYQDNQIYLNNPIDLFTLAGHGFFASKKLKQELEENNIVCQFSPLTKFSSILAFTKINVSDSKNDSNNSTEQSNPSPEMVLDKSEIQNIIDAIGETVLEKSKIPLEVQQQIETDFSPEEQELMLILFQKTLPSYMGQPLANSLLQLAKGKLKNINKCFPIYDPRDVIASAQSQKRVFENFDFEEEGYSIIFKEIRSDSNSKFEIIDKQLLKKIQKDWTFKLTNSLGRCGYDYQITVKKEDQIIKTFLMCFSCSTLYSSDIKPLKIFNIDSDFVIEFIKKIKN